MPRRCEILLRGDKGRCPNRATRLRDRASQFPVWVCRRCDERRRRRELLKAGRALSRKLLEGGVGPVEFARGVTGAVDDLLSGMSPLARAGAKLAAALHLPLPASDPYKQATLGAGLGSFFDAVIPEDLKREVLEKLKAGAGQEEAYADKT